VLVFAVAADRLLEPNTARIQCAAPLLHERSCLHRSGDTSFFLGAFAKLRKGSVSFVMSVRPFVRMEQLCSHWTDFHEICYLGMFRKSVETIQFSLKSDKNNGYFM
jgi:hypothetical protein